MMLEFTDDFLVPQPGVVRRMTGRPEWQIEVPLAPFSATDPAEPETYRLGHTGPVLVQTSLRLDFLELAVESFAELSDRRFVFPLNPHDGYVDASVYLGGAHNWIDVTNIDFGAVDGVRVTAGIVARVDFASEGVPIADRDLNLTAVLEHQG